MARSISWTDASELRALLENAAREAPKRVTEPPKVPAPQEASEPPKVSDAPPPAAPTPFEPKGETLEERVEHLIDWLAQASSISALFITDAHGLTIANRGVDAEQVAVCGTLMSALGEVRASLATEARRLALVINQGQVLHLVAIENSWGTFGVGVISPDFLSDALLARAQRALLTTLEHGEDD